MTIIEYSGAILMEHLAYLPHTIEAQKPPADLPALIEVAKQLHAKHEQARQEGTVVEVQPLIDLEKATIQAPEKRKVIDQCLGLLNEVMKGLHGYFIFASTAMYMHAKELPEDAPGRAEMMRSPGDLDMHITSEKTLRAVMQRLERAAQVDPEFVQQVHFENNGKPRQLRGQDTAVLPGFIIVQTDGKTYKYPFEFFMNHRGTDQLMQGPTKERVTTVNGLRVLSHEGLQRQYTRNYEIETRVDQAVERTMHALTHDKHYVHLIQQSFDAFLHEGVIKPEFQELLHQLEVASPYELSKLYVLYDQMQTAPERSAQHEDAKKQMAEILGPFKTKAFKRLHDAEIVAQLNRVEVSA